MKVKVLSGKYNPLYNILMPEGTETEDLPDHIQDSINVLGELRPFHTKDLSNENDEWFLEAKMQIKENGASVPKFNVVPSNPCIPTWPIGFNYTVVPFSELDELKRNKDQSNT